MWHLLLADHYAAKRAQASEVCKYTLIAFVCHLLMPEMMWFALHTQENKRHIFQTGYYRDCAVCSRGASVPSFLHNQKTKRYKQN
jgi:hypothetical protein